MKRTGWLPNYYARLGVPVDATPDEIRSAYRAAVRRLHPDVNPMAEAADLLQQLREAYEVLSDPAKRAEYDRLLGPDALSIPQVLFHVEYSRPALRPLDEPQLLYVLLELVPAPSEQQKVAPPLNVCLVLDKSTSMAGVRMDTVKATASQLLERLRPQDRFSVVAFSDRAEVVIPAAQNIDLEKADARIRMLHAGGGTEIFQGLQAGFEQIMRNFRPGQVNQIFLITDGRTYGDEAQCLDLAEQCAERDIHINGLGIGREWNDHFLDALAARTGGHTVYAANPAQLKKFLEQQFSSLERVFAEAVTLRLETPSGVTLRYAIRMAPQVSELPLEPEIALGALPFDRRLQVLLEFLVDPLPATQEEVLLARLRWQMFVPSRPVPQCRFQMELGRPVAEQVEETEPPQAIVEAMSRLVLYRLQAAAQEDVRQGDFRRATRRLKNLATHLLSQGETELAKTVLLEANRLEQGRGLSEDGKKQIKYGTRALLLPPAPDEDV